MDLYSNLENYVALTYEDTLNVQSELAPLIEPGKDDAKALRFYAMMYGSELAYLIGKRYTRARHDLKNYKEKAEYYVRQYKDNIVITKLR